MLTKTERRLKIKARVRGKVSGTPERPRLSVYRSNKQIYVQLINDIEGITIISASSRDKEVVETCKGKPGIEIAKIVGKLAAQRAIEKGITEISFDRGGYLYHGRVKSLADAAREGGLKF